MHSMLLVSLFVPAVLATKPSDGPQNNFAFPPKDKYCLFTSGDFVFEDRMKKLAPTATLDGVGTVQDIYAHHECEPMKLWGAIYHISNEDKGKVEEFAYEDRLTIADVTITKKEGTESMVCVSMDIGLLPHAYPLAIHKELSKDISVKDYLDRLTQIGVPQEYVTWLGTLPVNNKDCPTPAYVVSPSFYAPPIQGCPPTFDNGIGPQIQPYKMPDNKLCVFVGGELIFEKTMKSLVPSATLLGAAMLQDQYLGVGCPPEPDKFVKYKGFDNVWGVAYTIDQTDLDKFNKLGERHRFTADVRTRLPELTETTCKTNDIGLLPSGCPFSIFEDGTKVSIDAYAKRMKEVGVPAGYVDALVELGIKLDTYRELAKLPPLTLHDNVGVV